MGTWRLAIIAVASAFALVGLLALAWAVIQFLVFQGMQ
jgi:hypothetical protein